MLDEVDQISRAILLAVSEKESGLWLQALPIPTLRTVFDPETFRVAIALQVGSDVCVPHTCSCCRLMDAKGIHGLSCTNSAGRHQRHAVLNDVVRRALKRAGIPSILEPVEIDRGDDKKPEGISVSVLSNRTKR